MVGFSRPLFTFSLKWQMANVIEKYLTKRRNRSSNSTEGENNSPDKKKAKNQGTSDEEEEATTSCKNSGHTSPSWGVINFPIISHTAAPLPPLSVLLARQKNVGNLSSQH